MRTRLLSTLSLLMLAGISHAAPPLQDGWEEGYVNGGATGAHVLGCWKFDDMPLVDASGHGAQLMIAGAAPNAKGRFGGGLSCRISPVATRYSVVTAPSLARLSPAGAFSADLWARVTMDQFPQDPAHLLDKMDKTQNDYKWSLQPVDAGGRRRMVVTLGFGTFVKEFRSEPVLLPVGEWRHLAFSYDGTGRVEFFIGSDSAGGELAERCGPVTAGALPLSIGDGLYNHYGFPGEIDEVRLCDGVRGFAAFALEVIGPRKIWERYERGTPLKVVCTNLMPNKLKGAGLSYSLGGGTQSFILPDLAPGEKYGTEYGPDTGLKPGDYLLEVVMSSGGRKLSQKTTLKIMPRQPAVMPVILREAKAEDLPRLRELGATHWTGLTNENDTLVGLYGRRTAEVSQPLLEAGVASGLHAVAALELWRHADEKVHVWRMDRDGKPHEPHVVDAASSIMLALNVNSAQRFTTAFRECMTWSGTWLNAEPVSRARPGFSREERESYRKASQREIPDEVQDGGGVDWRKLAGFPQNRVVPDDHPVLGYYRWFWSGGHGWKAANDGWCQGLEKKRQERTDVWTLSEPAVRQPSVGGALGRVTYLADRALDNRQPLQSGLCVDQLLAMSHASGLGQGVFGMVPLSWERGAVSPPGAKGTAAEIHVQENGGGPVARVTLSPSILKESLWMTLARPVKGMIFPGWQALIPAQGGSSAERPTHLYAYTAFRDLADRVMRPLGPMLTKREPLRSQVAFLESFTSQVFAGRGLYRGASPRSLEIWQALQRGHVQTDIVYEEMLGNGGLDGRKVLVMTECDVLPASVVEHLIKWQQGGGKILADENLCPGLKADALLSKTGEISAQDTGLTRRAEEPKVRRDAPAGAAENAGQAVFQDLDKKAELEAVKAAASAATSADSLPKALARLCEGLGWAPQFRCDNDDIILHASRNGEATCLFVVNDRREAGNYVGQHGLVLENGVPSLGTLNLGTETVNVYDLTRAAFMLPKREDSGLTIPLRLGPGEGRVFMISPAPILDVTLDLPETAMCGNVAEAVIKVTTTGGKPMPAAIPVQVRIRDAEGATAEWDGAYVVENGSLTLKLQLASNETPGTWEVHVRDLASGIETAKWMKVSK
ncbi:LamG domain-containing protein [Brevifollis gellanilyticus]|nr:LamG domain-containing protein [Brevifollis gellanilyticus]